MSSSAKITEGGVPRNFSQVAKLKTNLQGGGTCLWVPEDTRVLMSKTINANGSYNAESDDFVYGYDEVTVQVPNAGAITGKDSTTGNDVAISIDPTTGDIVEKILPSSIDITTEPTKMEYNDGDTIDYTGMVVKAYDADGNIWEEDGYTGGVIPFAELALPVTMATTEQTATGSVSASVDGSTMYTHPTFGTIYAYDSLEFSDTSGRPFNLYFTSGTGIFIYQTGSVYVFSRTNAAYHVEYVSGSGRTVQWEQNIGGGNTTFDSNTTFFGAQAVSVSTNDLQESSAHSDTSFFRAAGTVWIDWAASGGSTSQKCPVNWNRPQDYKTLSDSIEITVSPVESGNAHGNENNGGEFEGGGSSHGF